MALPELTTDRLLLRPLRVEDAADMFAYSQDPLVARLGMWSPFESYSECEEYTRRLVARYKTDLMWWALEHRDSRKMIGRVQLSEWNRETCRAELSYALHFDYWGQGLMTEAVSPVVAYGWNELGLDRLGAVVLSYNIASVKILTRLGMEREGTLQRNRQVLGEWIDVDVYSVPRPEPSAQNPR